MMVEIIGPEELKSNITYYCSMVNKLNVCSVFQDPRWGLVIDYAYGYKPYLILFSDSKGEVFSSILMHFDERSKRVLADDAPCAQSSNEYLIDVIINVYRRVVKALLNPLRIEFRIFPCFRTKSTMLRTFSYRATKFVNKPLDELWKGFKKKTHVRYNVKKAERLGVKVYEASSERDYNIHIRLQYLSKFYGGLSPYDPHIKDFSKIIEGIKHYLQGNHKLFLAKIDNRVIATTLWIYDSNKKYAYYYDVGLDRRYKKYHAPDALMWYSITKLHSMGIRIIDLMGIDLHSKKSLFKKRYADIILPNKGFIFQNKLFFINYLKHYPYTLFNINIFLRSIIRHRTLGEQ